ncbi:MAG: hypothetical protein C4551_07285 [Bacillota bacterium]|nr:MAG: hypothetical protein C4551_07285 [Bacillota bacterium]
MVEFICRLGVLLPTGEPDPGAAPIGHFALGREVYDGSGGRPAIPVSFQIHNLVGRRTYVFRACYRLSLPTPPFASGPTPRSAVARGKTST